MRHGLSLLLIVASFGLAFGTEQKPEFPERRQVQRLPEFNAPNASNWINSEPLTVDDLAGRVVLLEFWTTDCVNCVRSLPWIKELDSRYAERGFELIGVHSPEFEHESDLNRLRDYIANEGITYPVLVDNFHVYWNKLGNKFWPAFYLIDRQGRIRHLQIGETRSGTESAKSFEQQIERLLAEPYAADSP